MKNNKLLAIVICAILTLSPCYVDAQQDGQVSEVNDEITSNESLENDENNGNNSESEDDNKEVVTDIKITLDKKELELSTGKEANLKANVTPSDANVEIVWSSSNEEIVSVDQTGKITSGSKAGQDIIITATIKGTDIKATCTVDVSRTIGQDATLKSLNISNGSLDQSFKSDVFKYSVTVDSDVNALKFEDLEKDLNDINAGYLVTGNSGLKNGSIVKILVTAEDKETQKTYELTIVKDTVSLALKKLEINGYALNESFDPEVLEYTASIPYEIETITVNASSVDSNVSVKVSGLTNLKVGANTVTVTVKDDSDNIRKYVIIVTREKEVSVEEKPTSIITSELVDNNQTSNNSGTASKDKDSSGDDSFLKYAIVSLACLILFAIGGIGIYFYLKTSPKRLKNNLKLSKDEKSNINKSATVEVSSKKEEANNSSIVEAMQENLVQTREFSVEDLKDNKKTENLFDDSEDV